MQALTLFQQRYVDAFAGNHLAACRKAGYKNPEASAKKNSQMDYLQAAIQAREAANPQNQKAIASKQDRQKFWTDFMNDEQQAPSTRLKASELLGRSEADFLDRVQQTGSQSVLIRIISNIPEPGNLEK